MPRHLTEDDREDLEGGAGGGTVPHGALTFDGGDAATVGPTATFDGGGA